MKNVMTVLGSALVLSLIAGCSVEAVGDELSAEGAADPSAEAFDYAPEGEEVVVEKVEPDDSLSPKGSAARVVGSTFNIPVTIPPNQFVLYTTSGGSPGVDPVLVLFKRHDNSSNFSVAPYTQRVGLTTLAINDDYQQGSLHASIGYANNTGQTINARLMVFAYGNSTGTVTLSGHGTVNVRAGSIRASATSGTVWTSNSSANPWLFAFDDLSGQSNAVHNDDTSTSNTESTIQGVPSIPMWYVAHGWGTGTTAINY